MTTYPQIKGLRVKYLSADPSGAENGQVWYNSTTSNLRVQGIGVASWSSASPMTTARANVGPSSAGTQTASFVAGGTPYTGVTEEYNGSGWSAGGALGTPRGRLGGAGTLTAGLVFGGLSPSLVGDTEEYNGTSWSEQNNLNTPRRNVTGCGIQTAGLAISGVSGAGSNSNATEEYDGSSWTSTGNLPTTSTQTGTAGIQTAALAFAFSTGSSPYNNNITCSYDGSSWTNVSLAMNTTRRNLTGAGSQNSALAIGGLVAPASVKTELYNGTSWAEQADMSTARYELGGSGTSTAALAFAGTTGSVTSATEEYNFSTTTVTPSTWSSGGTMPSSASQKNGSGILTAAFAVGGETPPGAMVNNTDEYDGTNWTSGGVIGSARGDVGAAGTLSAGLIMGGFQNTGTFLFSETEEYNGSAWSEVNNMPTGAYSASSTGTQTAAFICNMYIGSPGERTNLTYEYDGTNWSSGGNTAETSNSRSAVGTLTAGLVVGGRPAPSTFIDETELYNGTAWTAGVDMIQPFQAGGQSSKGTQTSCIIFGSPRSPVNTMTYEFDGTSWFTQPNLGTYQNNGTGTATSALAFGVSNTSQEWQAGSTSARAASNLSTS